MNLTLWILVPAFTFSMASRGRWRLGEEWNKWQSLLQRLTHSVSVIFGHNARTHEDKYLSPPILGRALRSLQCVICLEANSSQAGTHKHTLTHTQKQPDWLCPNVDLPPPTWPGTSFHSLWSCLWSLEVTGSAGAPYFTTQKCWFYTLKLFIYVVLQTASSFICCSAKLWAQIRNSVIGVWMEPSSGSDPRCCWRTGSLIFGHKQARTKSMRLSTSASQTCCYHICPLEGDREI